jgi:uncharacterized protein YjcR
MPKCSATVKLLEELYKMPLKDLLRELYVDEQMPMRKIAAKLHVSPGTVNIWLRREGVASRHCTWI